MVVVNQVNVTDYVSKSKLPVADYVINPYLGCPHKCIYCYAEFMRRFSRHEEAWGDFVDVKLCGKPINTKKIAGASVFIGSVTDPYNAYEQKYRITEQIMKQLAGCAAKIEILTKSALVVRDIELFKKIPQIRIGISMNSLDDAFRQRTEPRASSVRQKLQALQSLHDAGIETYLFMSPIFPGITDFRAIIEAARTHAGAFYFENLNLRAGYYSRVMQFIEAQYPQLLSLYEDIFKKKNIGYWEELEGEITQYCTQHELKFASYFYHEKIKKR